MGGKVLDTSEIGTAKSVCETSLLNNLSQQWRGLERGRVCQGKMTARVFRKPPLSISDDYDDGHSDGVSFGCVSE